MEVSIYFNFVYFALRRQRQRLKLGLQNQIYKP